MSSKHSSENKQRSITSFILPLDRVAQNLHQYARYGVESWDLTFSQSPFAAEVLALYFKMGWGHLLIRNVLNVGEPQL